MKKTILTIALASLSLGVNAAYLDEETGEVVVVENPELLGESARGDETPDPSDLTKVNSFIWAQASNKNNLKVNLGLAGAYSEGNNFISLIEHDYNVKDKAHNSRVRYFQVLDTDLAAMPQAGVSVDYMKGWGKNSSDLIALGSIVKVKTPWERLTLFPNVAYVMGAAKNEGAKFDATGYQTNLFGSVSIGDWGQYIMLQPQYMHLDAKQKGTNRKAPVDVFKMRTAYGQPMSQDGKLWMDIAHEYQRTSAKVNGTRLSATDNEHRFEVGMSYYF